MDRVGLWKFWKKDSRSLQCTWWAVEPGQIWFQMVSPGPNLHLMKWTWHSPSQSQTISIFCIWMMGHEFDLHHKCYAMSKRCDPASMTQTLGSHTRIVMQQSKTNRQTNCIYYISIRLSLAGPGHSQRTKAKQNKHTPASDTARKDPKCDWSDTYP